MGDAILGTVQRELNPRFPDTSAASDNRKSGRSHWEERHEAAERSEGAAFVLPCDGCTAPTFPPSGELINKNLFLETI